MGLATGRRNPEIPGPGQRVSIMVKVLEHFAPMSFRFATLEAPKYALSHHQAAP
jgi:hypothetical protein